MTHREHHAQPDGARQQVQAVTHGHAKIDLTVEPIRSLDELLAAWLPAVRRLNQSKRRGAPASVLSMLVLLIHHARPLRPGCWLSRWPSIETFKRDVGLDRASFRKGKAAMLETGLVADSKLGPPWVVLFSDSAAAREGEPEPQPCLFDGRGSAHAPAGPDARGSAHDGRGSAHDARFRAHRTPAAYTERGRAPAAAAKEQQQASAEVAEALRAAGIGRPTLDELADLAAGLPEGEAVKLVERTDAERRRRGKGTGVLVENLRAAIPARARALAEQVERRARAERQRAEAERAAQARAHAADNQRRQRQAAWDAMTDAERAAAIEAARLIPVQQRMYERGQLTGCEVLALAERVAADSPGTAEAAP